jgi:hypothetical protein
MSTISTVRTYMVYYVRRLLLEKYCHLVAAEVRTDREPVTLYLFNQEQITLAKICTLF